MEKQANLLVENRQVSRKLRGILEATSYEVSLYSDLKKLTQHLKTEEVHLLVVQASLAGDPFTFLRRLRGINGTVRVILVGRRTSTEKALKWINSGGFAYYDIPPDYDDFRSKVKGLALIYQNQQFLLETHRNLTRKLRETSEKLSEEAREDDLTGLVEKGYFNQRAEELLSYHKLKNLPLSFIVFDIDHFKKFNDSHGHPEGDRVLEELASVIESVFRSQDVKGRIGGEEFAVLLARADKHVVVKTARRLRERVEKYSFPGEESQPGGRLTISVGTSSFPTHGESVDRLLELADRATFFSKELGRNSVTGTTLHEFSYNPALDEPLDSVEVVGEFNNWDRGEKLERHEDGVWREEIPVPAGELTYGFLLNGDKLAADPDAASFEREDGREVSRVRTG